MEYFCGKLWGKVSSLLGKILKTETAFYESLSFTLKKSLEFSYKMIAK